MRGECRPARPPVGGRPDAAGERASWFPADDVLQHLLVQGEVGRELPQLRVPLFELAESPHLRCQQTAVALASVALEGVEELAVE